MQGMIEVGSLTRDLAASVSMAVEDELDWEHLPHVHRTTFRAASLIHADRDGWAAEVELIDATPMRMQVKVDPDRRGYTNATSAGGAENGRAVVRFEETGSESCRINLRFFIPDGSGFPVEAAGAFYRDLFSRILDEDEPKMIHRAAAIKAGPSGRKARRSAAMVDGSRVQVPFLCPHQGLPLNCEPDESGLMTCPWHGYKFDARTGACVHGKARGWTD